MASEVFNYIAQVNKLSEELLHSHSDLLERKNIRRKHDLIQAIKLDLDKLGHALTEVKDNDAESVLQRFFNGLPVDLPDICARLTSPLIYHVGFEIHEPLSLVLYGINHWIEHSKRVLGVHMRVKDYLRFPASQAFQDRVSAYVEIMRIWLEVNERVLMLELFDIYRPADSALAAAPKFTHRNFNGLFQGEDMDRHGERLTRVFAVDEIWHYAFYVRRPSDVLDLHAKCQSLAANNRGYFLPYTAPVHNRYDGSFHTKIVRTTGARLEVEFVTQYSDQKAALAGGS